MAELWAVVFWTGSSRISSFSDMGFSPGTVAAYRVSLPAAETPEVMVPIAGPAPVPAPVKAEMVNIPACETRFRIM